MMNRLRLQYVMVLELLCALLDSRIELVHYRSRWLLASITHGQERFGAQSRMLFNRQRGLLTATKMACTTYYRRKTVSENGHHDLMCTVL